MYHIPVLLAEYIFDPNRIALCVLKDFKPFQKKQNTFFSNRSTKRSPVAYKTMAVFISLILTDSDFAWYKSDL